MYENTVPGYSRSSSAHSAFLPSFTVLPGTNMHASLLQLSHLCFHWACVCVEKNGARKRKARLSHEHNASVGIGACRTMEPWCLSKDVSAQWSCCRRYANGTSLRTAMLLHGMKKKNRLHSRRLIIANGEKMGIITNGQSGERTNAVRKSKNGGSVTMTTRL